MHKSLYHLTWSGCKGPHDSPVMPRTILWVSQDQPGGLRSSCQQQRRQLGYRLSCRGIVHDI